MQSDIRRPSRNGVSLSADVVLKGASYVIGITVVEGTCQVQVIEYGEETCLIAVARVGLEAGWCQGYEIRSIHLEYVVTTYHGDGAFLGDYKHIIGSCELDETKEAPCCASHFHSSIALVTIVNSIEKLDDLLLGVYNFVVCNAQTGILRRSVYFEDPVSFLCHVTPYNVESGWRFRIA